MQGAATYNLDRFVKAQEPVLDQACLELRNGRKTSHWMWFVFPQISGLGHSASARYFGISSLAEATAYLEHPILGPRLVLTTSIVVAVEGRSAEQIFGFPDYLKFRSSMTLFGCVPSAEPVFASALRKFFAGVQDQTTLMLLLRDPDATL
jgi:uncharacterized protein (DUF1810 family)